VTAALEGEEMAEREEVGDHTIHVPEHMIETINKLVRTSRQMLLEIGREPTSEELAVKLAMPLENVRKVSEIAKRPIRLQTPIGDE
jgi:RNA polymerase primary sigma factor